MSDDAAADVAAVYAPAAYEALNAFCVEVGSIELVSHSENVTYRVVDRSDGLAYVLHLHRSGYHTIDELISQRDWIRALADAGFAVQVPMATRDGKEFASVRVPDAGAEYRFAGLARWTDGRLLSQMLDEADDAVWAEQRFEQLGALTASLHEQSASWQPPARFTRHALDADGLLGSAPYWGRFWEHRGFSAVESRVVLDARDRLYADLARLERTPAGYSLIHADLHRGNVLVDGDDDRLTAIDFDDAAWGWHVYDIAIALYHPPQGPRFSAAFEDAYIAGYRSVRPLSEEALSLLPKFRLIRALSHVGWAHQRPEIDRSVYFEAAKDALLEQCLGVAGTPR